MSACIPPAAAPSGLRAEIHGHTILRWLAETPLTADALGRRVDQELGQDVQFYTCDTSGLSLSKLLALLAERGKITHTDDGWTSDLSKPCGHDD